MKKRFLKMYSAKEFFKVLFDWKFVCSFGDRDKIETFATNGFFLGGIVENY